jgi:hypothetical protein
MWPMGIMPGLCFLFYVMVHGCNIYSYFGVGAYCEFGLDQMHNSNNLLAFKSFCLGFFPLAISRLPTRTWCCIGVFLVNKFHSRSTY